MERLNKPLWNIIKSSVDGSNKGISILSYKDGIDYIEIARQSKNEFTIARYYGQGSKDLIDYEFNSEYLKSKEFHKELKEDYPNIPKISNALNDLDIMIDETDDWGDKKSRDSLRGTK